MSELQLALIAAGVIAIALVWLYNVLDERKQKKAAEALFRGEHDDVLLRTPRPIAAHDTAAAEQGISPTSAPHIAERREPGLSSGFSADEIVVAQSVLAQSGASSAAETSALDHTDQRHRVTLGTPSEPSSVELASVAPLSVPVTESMSVSEPQSQAQSPTESPTEPSTELPTESSTRYELGPDDLLPWADPIADCLVSFTTPEPILASALWAAQSAWSGIIEKPLHWLARKALSDPWTPLSADLSHEASGERYTQWMAALQLVDRAGPISDAGLSRFSDGMQQIARQTGAQIAPPLRSEMLLRAQDLDRFCANVDVQFSISVVSAQGNAFAGTKLRGVCEAAGLALDRDGLYRYRNAAGESEFSLGNLGNEAFDPAAMSSLATHGVSLTIDVPRVADGAAAFSRMVQVARQLAQGLGGTLVDGHRVALSDSVIATIRSKIIEVQTVLNKAGIVPGAARALRLFS
jgi:hypothetical protein